jgi:preprotein translocase subunit SecF
MQLFPIGKVYGFMAQRKLWAVVSVLMVSASIVGLFVPPGPNMGTDFKGGTEIELAFGGAVGDDDIRSAVQAAGFSSPDVIRVNDSENPNRFLIRVQEISTISDENKATLEAALCFGDNLDAERCPEDKQASEVKFSPGGDKITVRYRATPDLEALKAALVGGVGGIAIRDGDNNLSVQNERENRVEIQLKSKGDVLMDGLTAALGAELVPEHPLRVEWVGPKAGALLRDAAMKSIAIALIFIMVYIAFRFDLRFAPGAVVALIHDSVVTVGVLILIQREISLTTVAALLTIVGYSVNDTVVVYDRVRENLGKLRGTGFTKVIDISLSEMLSRTVLTSGTTIFSLSAFFYWGTGALEDFALTLVTGIVLGTYSSIYVALPLTYWLDRRFFSKVAPKRAPQVRPKKAEAIV